ncbi:uncharacterized protein FRV6_10434 [Fusarium oxysporum]|uniref:Uncharacterized protein n=1 Tax=Fusarium oxysporum TaxID=5507 RepID=A0A2H3TCK1_FUSOX|nr:uncharacterized protein FRV6_10434 [Fusarium oxysporum]
MESSRANSGQSAPLMAQDLQPSTVVGFQQQGTVDWTRIMSGSVTFSVDVLSRLSKAGVEAFTIYAARAIFSNVKLGPNGELRLHRALDKLSAFPSFGKALWFGFGVKHIIWSMQESTEGLNCLGICACLTEGYSTIVAAKTIRELFLLYNPPAELTPALRQWLAGMSVICMQQDLEVRPTRSGLESLYWDQGYVVPDLDPVAHGLLKSWPACGSLMLAQMLFSGQQQVRVLGRESIAATSHSGLCFCLNTLMEITSDPQRACVVTVVPGKIEWNNFMYSMVSDHISGVTGTLEVTGYDAVSMASVTKYDDLADSSSPGLNAELIIEEVFPESTSLSAIYRVSTAVFPSRHFPIGPSAIWHKLGDAYTAASCEGKTCDSLNGYQSILVKGEGLLLRTPDWQRTRLPITRVLSAKDVSVWVALSQTGLWTKDASMNDISISVIHRLQDQCDDCFVSIITSV